ncbi:uncharacterized protein DUF4360 [Actinomadura pelletieri DSM 43383]|uniref:Uncharacterized protein DUF4360 n=1 Tax=Actinomadura pelletieri DSM 43383 TaxID=1120940 RepID=A0A495QRZ0_9ACTN|nr:DUF4360 domain-containing protein [Actinomadura pelletieri]RKS76259.1 uncharacterized protein DUF4360 [Actinomadura pelletieri DSM 43383]
MLNTGRALPAILGVTLALPALTATGAGAAVADPPPDGVTIEIGMVSGTDCTPGAMSLTISPDNQSFTLERDEVRVEVGGANPATERRRCTILLRVLVPQGYSYAIKPAVDYRGHAELEPDASGVLTVSNHLQGTPNTPKTHSLHGPFSGPWRFQPPDSDPVFSPCGERRSFIIDSELQVSLGTSDKTRTSYMTMAGEEVHPILYKRCRPT